MNGIQLAHRATIGLVAGVAGLGMGVAAYGAAEAASKDDASAITKLGANLGLPIVTVGSIISIPAAAKGSPMAGALLGAIGVGAAAGIFASAFSSIGDR
jgi:hypothetical protein